MLLAAHALTDEHDSLHAIPGFADPVSSLTHLIAAGIFAFASISLLRSARGHRGRLIALSIYAGSVVLLLAMSGVFHLLTPETAGRTVLQRLDHACIFVLIAGTFTAVHGIVFHGWLRWGIIAFVWVVAATAIPLKTIFFEDMPEWLGLTLYLAFPWVGLLSGILLWRRHGVRFISPFLLGGVAYTIGAVLEFVRWPNPWPGVIHAHELFHLFVIAGAGWHWQFCATIAQLARAEELSARPVGPEFQPSRSD
ncbi:MAG: hemolysin III family protein [Planctomycetota bacterium]